MPNQYKPKQKVIIADGSQARRIWTQDGLVFDVDVPDGTGGVVANVLQGGNVYTVGFQISHLGRDWNAFGLFIEAHLSPTS